MNIARYAIAELYGYGFLRKYGRSNMSRDYVFTRNARLIAPGGQSLSFSDGICERVFLGNNVQPLFLVSEDETENWHEYFTGMPVDSVAYSDYPPALLLKNRTDVVEYQLNGHKDGCSWGPIGKLSISNRRICSPEEFSEKVEKYSKGQIKKMADQIYALSSAAGPWYEKVNSAISQLLENQQGASVSQKLNSGYGQYAKDASVPKNVKLKSQGGACYIATAVYGSYDCPEVWTLRRFRDAFLAERIWGRVFIRAYYAISPALVRLFSRDKRLKALCKLPLDKLVYRLRVKGYKATLYKDPD